MRKNLLYLSIILSGLVACGEEDTAEEEKEEQQQEQDESHHIIIYMNGKKYEIYTNYVAFDSTAVRLMFV